MEIQDFFPIWTQLTAVQQTRLQDSAEIRRVKKGAVLHNGGTNCSGLLLIQQGQLRAYNLSPEGREITLYRLFDRDICLFSASCVIPAVQFTVMIEAEKDTLLWRIPPDVFQAVLTQSAPLSNFTNEVMASRFSEVMWRMEQIMWKSFDRRLAKFLLEEYALAGHSVLKLTHEAIANHLGTAREVVTRMLRCFQSEDMVKLMRGSIEITDAAKLEQLSAPNHI